MAQMSSEEALNGIFNILDTMVVQQQREREKSPEVKADETVINLLNGIVEKAKDNTVAAVGEQLEKLAKGLTAMKEVDHDMIDHVATSIGNVNKVLNNLQVNDTTIANVEKFIDTMAKIGEINTEGSKKIIEFINNLQINDPKATMQNISIVIGTVKAMNIIAATDMKALQDNLANLDVKTGERIGKFIEVFIDSIEKSNPDNKEIKELIQPISDLMTGLSDIVNTGVWKMSISLNPIKGYLLGRQIGQFLKQIIKATNDMKVPENIKGLGEILDPLVKLADAKNSYSLWNIVKVMNSTTGKLINNFYKELIKDLDEDNTHKSVIAMSNILDVFLKLDSKKIKSFVSAAKIMDPKQAQRVNQFIRGLIAGKWDPKKLDSVRKFITEWRNILWTIVGAIAAVVLIATIAPIESLLMGVGILYFSIKFMKNTIIELIKGIKESDVKNANKILHNIGYVISMAVGMIAVIALITKFAGIIPVTMGLGVLWFTLYSVKKFILELADKDVKNNLAQALKSLQGISILILTLSTSTAIITGTIASFGLVTTLLGLAVIAAVVSGGIYAVKTLTAINSKDIDKGLTTLLKLAGVFAVVALVTDLILIPIGKKAGKAALGGVVVTAIVGLLIGCVFILSKVNPQDMMQSLKNMAILTLIYAGISIVTSTLLIPIADKTESAILGAGVILLITGALIFGVYMLSKLDGKTALWGVFATAAIAVVYLGIALITKEILIPIGERTKEAGIGAGVTLLIISALMIGVWVLSKLDGKTALYGILATAAIAVILLGVSLITKEILIPIGEQWQPALIGAGVVIGLLLIMGTIMAIVGYFGKALAEPLAKGAIIMTALSVVMTLVGAAVYIFALECNKINELNKGGAVFIGALIIIGLIGLMGLVMTGVGLLVKFAPLTAIGGVIMIGIGVIMTLTGAAVLAFALEAKAINDIGSEEIFTGAGIMVKVLALMGTVMTDIGLLAPLLPLIAIGNVILLAIGGLMTILAATMNTFINIIKKITDTVTVDTIHAFSNIVIGTGNNDPNSVLGSLNRIIEGFSKFDGVAKALIISYAIRPIIDTIEQYIDVIMKIATMNYIEGYDENGKPIYKHLPADTFSSAANAVTKSFQEFLQSLNNGFDGLSISGAIAMSIISKAIKPVVDLVGKFVDVVMKVATGTYIIGYDENGKPEYKHLNASDFKSAGTAVADTFSHFIQSLGDSFGKLSIKSIFAMQIMKKVMSPIMESVSDFVDTVIKVATMNIITGYDENGKPEYEQIDVKSFETAGVVVASTFGLFITNLGNAFEKLSINARWSMNVVRDSIAPVMDGVSSFADAILKLAAGQYIDRYDKDKDGNYTVPHFKKITEQQYITAAFTISTMFALFIDKLTEAFSKHGSFWGNKTEDALEAIGDSIAPVMEGVGQYVDAILQLATGTYIDHMAKDKDGKFVPIYKHITPKQFEKAAETVKDMFITFIDALVNAMNKGDFIKKAEAAKDAISDSINPIMQAVKDFSEALKPFLQLTTKGKDAKTSDYICLKPGKIKEISKGIANAFVTFIGVISDNLSSPANKAKYESIKGTAKDVQTVLAIIKKATGSLSSIIKSMKNEDGKVLEDGSKVATQFISVLTTFANYFSTSGELFTNAIEPANNCKDMIDKIRNISKVYADIIRNINQLSSDKVTADSLINSFNSNLLKITNEMMLISNKSESINFTMIREMTDTYLRIALMLAQTSDFMVEHENMESGINKFITNIRNLTAPDFNSQMELSAGSITLYTTRLKGFTQQVEVTTGKVEIYITKLEAAREALAALDEQIISKENERNRALQTFADKINNIAKAVDNMRNAFESLDEDSILSRFDGIRALLELVSGNDNTSQQTSSKQNQSQGKKQQFQQSRSQQSPQERGLHQRPEYKGMPSSGMVTFEFKDTTLRGFFRSN